MPPPKTRARAMSRLWANDEELAKKDDDLVTKPGNGLWTAARTPRRSSVLRLVAYLVVVVGLFMLVGRLFGSKSDPSLNKYIHDVPTFEATIPQDGRDDGGSGKKTVQVEQKKTYSGPIKLPGLGQSLHAIAGTQGKQSKNRNVLFAAASLRSASTLLPLACKMAMERQNYVHFAFMGRSDIPMLELLKVNGINKEECQMILHDARPDHSATSTETRMSICAARAMYHINLYMHPQAIMIDSTTDEESYFLNGVRDQVRSFQSALIELPDRPGTRLAWMTKLDSAALAAWDKVHVDIVIHAPPQGSGNLKRLLRSLAQMDMGAMPIPHLTIELPHRIDAQAEKFISTYQWPPKTGHGGHRPHMLSLRHRIPRASLSEEEASVRFLESFWPRNPRYSYVLVLSPNTEVTPQFLHYLKYSLLHYRHSNGAIVQNWDTNMMGLSFSTPAKILDNSQPISLPELADDEGNAFLWQAPSSDATLFSGDKWIELHGYVSQVLERQSASSGTPAMLAHKEISKRHPAWLEYVLQLSRLRGYYTVYPGSETSSSIIGVHNDIPEVPEEYLDDEEARLDAQGDGLEDGATESFDAHWGTDVLETLPHAGTLPYITRVPVLAWNGQESSIEGLQSGAANYAMRFRSEVGHCPEDTAARPPHRLANDLFCKANNA